MLCCEYWCNPLSFHQTVGTLLTGAYSAGGCLLGAIFGTGTNGAYVEDQGALKKLSGNTAVPGDGQKMIVNCEWGAFDNDVSSPKRQSSLPSSSTDSEEFSLEPNSTQNSIASPSTRECLRCSRPAMCTESFQAQTKLRENDFWHVPRRDCTQYSFVPHRSATGTGHGDSTPPVSPVQWVVLQNTEHPLWSGHGLHVRHCRGIIL